jgi:hypothetical protein
MVPRCVPDLDYVGFGRDGRVAVPEAVRVAASATIDTTTDELETPVRTRTRRRTSIEVALSGHGIDRSTTSMTVETNPSGA